MAILQYKIKLEKNKMPSFQQKLMSHAKKQESMDHILGLGGKHSVETEAQLEKGTVLQLSVHSSYSEKIQLLKSLFNIWN